MTHAARRATLLVARLLVSLAGLALAFDRRLSRGRPRVPNNAHRGAPPRLICRLTPSSDGWEARRIEPDAPALGACGGTAGQALDALLGLAGAGRGRVSAVVDVPASAAQ